MLGRQVAAVLMVLALATAGCMSADQGTDDEAVTTTGSTSGAPGAAQDGVQTLEMPTWQVGDWWTWRSDQLGEYSYVVTGEQRGDWLVGTDNEDIAFFDARNDVSFLGEVRKSDLAGSQNDTRVQYFQWPLTEGESWSTTWDGVKRSITVTDISDGVASLEAREGERLAVTYEYDSSTGWFGEVTFHDANGSAAFRTTAVASGSNFTGEVVTWDLGEQVSGSGTLQPVATPTGFEFSVPENATDIWLSLDVGCPSGEFSLGFGPDEDPSGSAGWGVTEVCPYEESLEGPVVEQPAAGDWSGGILATSPAEQGTYSFQLIVRTLETVPVGS